MNASTTPDDPQAAFHAWLRSTLQRLLDALRHDERDAFLARAVDHADLERRLRVQDRRMLSLFY
jgi:hypothetical protein